MGYIDENGKYHAGEDKSLIEERGSTYRDWHQGIERKIYAKEIIQPRVKGRPNPQFIKAYPEYSHKYFTQEEIDKALREEHSNGR